MEFHKHFNYSYHNGCKNKATQIYDLGPAPGNLLEMQILQPHPRPTGPECLRFRNLCFNKVSSEKSAVMTSREQVWAKTKAERGDGTWE